MNEYEYDISILKIRITILEKQMEELLNIELNTNVYKTTIDPVPTDPPDFLRDLP